MDIARKAQKKAQKSAAVVVVLAFVLAGCSGPEAETDPSGQARAGALQGQAENEQQAQVADTVNKLLDSFREGSAVPEGWPANSIPVPSGTKPVASLQKSTLPNGAETMSMFYASGQDSGEIQNFFLSQLPKRDWFEVKPQEEGELRWVTAETDTYNGLFMAGPVPSLPRLASGEIIDVLVILTKPRPSPAP